MTEVSTGSPQPADMGETAAPANHPAAQAFSEICAATSPELALATKLARYLLPPLLETVVDPVLGTQIETLVDSVSRQAENPKSGLNQALRYAEPVVAGGLGMGVKAACEFLPGVPGVSTASPLAIGHDNARPSKAPAGPLPLAPARTAPEQTPAPFHGEPVKHIEMNLKEPKPVGHPS